MAATVWVKTSSRLMNESMAMLLESAGFEVCTGEALSRQADIAILDLGAADPSSSVAPELPTLMIIGENREELKKQLLAAGYKGYLSGGEGLKELSRAIEVVLKGELWAERSVMSSMISGSRTSALTTRENEVLKLVGLGLANKQIASRLDISEKTVKVYVSSLLDKLGAKNRLDLVINWQHLGAKKP